MSNAFATSIQLNPSKDKVKLERIILAMMLFLMWLFQHPLMLIFSIVTLLVAYTYVKSSVDHNQINEIMFRSQCFLLKTKSGKSIECTQLRVSLHLGFVFVVNYHTANDRDKSFLIYADQLSMRDNQRFYQAYALQQRVDSSIVK